MVSGSPVPDTEAPHPLFEKPAVAFLLAILAGVLSGYTFFLDRLFATVQSGNVIQMGFWLFGNDGDGNSTKWVHAAVAVLAFGLGAMCTVIIEQVVGEFGADYSWPILFCEAIALVVLGFTFVNERFDLWIMCAFISFLAGMQGNAFHKINGMLYGNVAVTLVVQLAFSYLMQGIFRKPEVNFRISGAFFLVLLGFAGGGFIGAFLTKEFDHRALWFAAGLAIVLGVMGMVGEKDNLPVDPT